MTEFAGHDIPAENARWSFSGPCAEVFDQHIQQSVPLYQAAHDVVLNISDFFVHENSKIYDLGCATGVLTRRLAQRHHAKSPNIIGIDTEPDMVKLAQAHTVGVEGVEIIAGNLVDMPLGAADLIVAFYTMQFVRAKYRQSVFDKIYHALNWGGGFLLFEKVRAPDARFQDMMTTIYHDWKQYMGFLPDEIMAKTNALKGVLDPFSTQGNLDLLRRAGFQDVMTVFKMIGFEGFLAIK